MVVCGNSEEVASARKLEAFIMSPEGHEIHDALRLLDGREYEARDIARAGPPRDSTAGPPNARAEKNRPRRDHLSTTTARDDAYQLVDNRDYQLRKGPTPRTPSACSPRSEAATRRWYSRRAWRPRPTALRCALSPGAHVIAPRRVPPPTSPIRRGSRTWRSAGHVAVASSDTTDADGCARPLRPDTAVVWSETPAEPTWDVTRHRRDRRGRALRAVRGSTSTRRRDGAGPHPAARARRPTRHALATK